MRCFHSSRGRHDESRQHRPLRPRQARPADRRRSTATSWRFTINSASIPDSLHATRRNQPNIYDFHRDAGTGPILNPFPLDLSRRSRRAHAHHNPMDEWKHERTGRYRPVVPRRIPRAIPDDWFNKLFAALSNRGWAMVAFWISTGARASELLGMRRCDFHPGQQLISLVRKGSRARQQIPASADAFVWQRLCLQG